MGITTVVRKVESGYVAHIVYFGSEFVAYGEDADIAEQRVVELFESTMLDDGKD